MSDNTTPIDPAIITTRDLINRYGWNPYNDSLRGEWFIYTPDKLPVLFLEPHDTPDAETKHVKDTVYAHVLDPATMTTGVVEAHLLRRDTSHLAPELRYVPNELMTKEHYDKAPAGTTITPRAPYKRRWVLIKNDAGTWTEPATPRMPATSVTAALMAAIKSIFHKPRTYSSDQLHGLRCQVIRYGQ